MTIAGGRSPGRAATFLWCLGLFFIPVTGLAAESEPPPRAFFRTCGSCPSGYATTGIITDAVTCPENDHQFVQCAPLGLNQLMVCGDCPEGYQSIGSAPSSTRCGTPPSGKLNQCQLQKLEGGGVQCPPNCSADRPPPIRKTPAPGTGEKP